MTRKLYILARDENVFHPRFFHTVLRTKPPRYTVVGAAMVANRETLLNALRYVLRMGGVSSLFRLATRIASLQLRLRFQRSPLTSVRNVFVHFDIPVQNTPTPNDPDFLDHLEQQRPDVVFCAVPNILKEPILSLPTLACVNRHAGWLPGYRGLEPVFQALRQGEPRTTVTYHTMIRDIDGGKVLWEHHEPVQSGDSVYALYDRLFQAAALGFWQALENLENGGGRWVNLQEGRYFSVPTDAQIAEFHRQGWRYV